MRNAFAKTITNLALKDDRIILIIGDTGSGLFDDIQEKAPKQFLNTGIAEANMVSMAAGLSRSGFIPFVYAIGAHLIYRAYEQIRNDLCLNNCNVKIISVGSGVHYADHGPTHHSTEDFGILRVTPNIKIFSPSGDYETSLLTELLVNDLGPSYLRLGRGRDTITNYDVKLGNGVIIKEGKDLAIVTTGSGVYDSYNLIDDLKNENIDLELINLHTIKPIDSEMILKSIKKTKKF